MTDSALTILQVNIGRQKSAMSDLRRYCDGAQVDILCIQEPAMARGKPLSFPTGVTFFAAQDDPKAVTIIWNKKIVALGISQYSSQHLVTVEIQ